MVHHPLIQFIPSIPSPQSSGRSLLPWDHQSPRGSEDEGEINERLRTSIVAEQRLCELTGKLVLAIIARVVDASGAKRGSLKKRLLHNKTGLGPNYREVLSYLEERKPRNAARNKGNQPAKAAGAGQAPTAAAAAPEKDFKSAERVEEDDEDGDQAESVEEDEEADLRARGLVEEDIDREHDENEDPNPPESDEDEVMGD